MQRLKKLAISMLHPAIALRVFLAMISAAALVCIFTAGLEETVAAYVVYALAAYSLVVIAIGIPQFAAKARKFVYSSKLGNRIMADIPFRVKLSLYISLTLNLLYAAIKLFAGVRYASFWYGADALYYIALSVARLLLTMHMRKGGADIAGEYRKYRLCGYLLFFLTAALTGVVYQIAYQNMGYEYPGLLIYVVAAYTFASLALAVANLIKFRKAGSPVLSAVKIIGFVRALVAIFALQTALFASFGDGAMFQRIMNLVFGACVCCAVFYIAVTMVIRANKELKTHSINSTET